jgi:hypothetical protein
VAGAERIALQEATGASLAKAGVLANQAKGNAFRNEIADLMQKAGREVQTEVSKKTPFGTR